jgi:hypothetical protein
MPSDQACGGASMRTRRGRCAAGSVSPSIIPGSTTGTTVPRTAVRPTTQGGAPGAGIVWPAGTVSRTKRRSIT